MRKQGVPEEFGAEREFAGGALALGLIVGAVLTSRRNKLKRYETYRRRFEEEMRQERLAREPAARRRSEPYAETPRARRPVEQTRRAADRTRRQAETRRPVEQTRRPRVTEVQRPRRPRGNMPEDPEE